MIFAFFLRNGKDVSAGFQIFRDLGATPLDMAAVRSNRFPETQPEFLSIDPDIAAVFQKGIEPGPFDRRTDREVITEIRLGSRFFPGSAPEPLGLGNGFRDLRQFPGSNCREKTAESQKKNHENGLFHQFF